MSPKDIILSPRISRIRIGKVGFYQSLHRPSASTLLMANLDQMGVYSIASSRRGSRSGIEFLPIRAHPAEPTFLVTPVGCCLALDLLTNKTGDHDPSSGDRLCLFPLGQHVELVVHRLRAIELGPSDIIIRQTLIHHKV
jgi:hypothetical protein